MRRLVISAVVLFALGSVPAACGGDDDEGDGSSTGGSGGSDSGVGGNDGSATGGSGGSGGTSTGGSAGASTGGTAGTSSGGTAGSQSDGSAGASTGGGAGATGDSGTPKPMSKACIDCSKNSCKTAFDACQKDAACKACIEQDSTGCNAGNTLYKAICTCGVIGGGPCHNECGPFCG